MAGDGIKRSILNRFFGFYSHLFRKKYFFNYQLTGKWLKPFSDLSLFIRHPRLKPWAMDAVRDGDILFNSGRMLESSHWDPAPEEQNVGSYDRKCWVCPVGAILISLLWQRI